MEKRRLKCQLSIDSITDQEWKNAMDVVADKITRKVGNPQQGAYSERVLGVPAKDFFSMLAFDMLFTGKKKLKGEYSLESQMKWLVRGLMSNHEKHYKRIPAPIIEFFDDYREMLADSLPDNEVEDVNRQRYKEAEEVALDDIVLLEFVRLLPECDTYNEIAEEMRLPIDRIYDLSRKLRRRLEKAGYIDKKKIKKNDK